MFSVVLVVIDIDTLNSLGLGLRQTLHSLSEVRGQWVCHVNVLAFIPCSYLYAFFHLVFVVRKEICVKCETSSQKLCRLYIFCHRTSTCKKFTSACQSAIAGTRSSRASSSLLLLTLYSWHILACSAVSWLPKNKIGRVNSLDLYYVTGCQLHTYMYMKLFYKQANSGFLHYNIILHNYWQLSDSCKSVVMYQPASSQKCRAVALLQMDEELPPACHIEPVPSM